jgi:biopolymer transport protein TolR
MAVQLQRGTRGRGRQPMSEINVTPMVDVMLVLLIIFMITAPLLTVGVPVDLPKTDAPQITQPSEPLVISIDKDGLIYLQESETDTKIFVRGDRNVDYGRIMEVMGTVASAGFAKVALIAEMPGQGGGGN